MSQAPAATMRNEAAAAAAPAPVTKRLRQLDREWDQEQALQLGAAVVGFTGAVLSLAVSSAFIILPALAAATLAQYLVQGWCPALPLLARLGLRSCGEIDRERYTIVASLGETREPRLPAAGSAGAD